MRPLQCPLHCTALTALSETAFVSSKISRNSPNLTYLVVVVAGTDVAHDDVGGVDDDGVSDNALSHQDRVPALSAGLG